MSDTVNPLAPHHLPIFIATPGETDTLLVIMAVFLVILIVAAGLIYFHLHAIPEHKLHGTDNKAQFELVAVLALLALFTHNSLFWVLALILAMIPVPDIVTPLYGMARSLKMLATGRSGEVAPAAAARVEESPVPESLSTASAPEAKV